LRGRRRSGSRSGRQNSHEGMAVPKFQRGPEVGPVPRPGALEIEPYVPGSSREQRTPRTVILSSNESALGASPSAVAAYERGSHALHRYPDSASTELRDALAVAHGVDAAQIVCGDGSDELLHLLALGYAGPGDDVLFSEHGFVVYPMAAHAVGARPRSVPERGYTVDVDAMIAAVTPETRIMFVANPNSTGTCLPASEIARLHAALPAGVLLVIDAAYAEFVAFDGYEPGLDLVRTSTNTVMTRTFSKAYGLAGLRLGWCFAPPPVVDVLNRLRGPFNVTAPAQAAGVAAVGDKEFLEQVRVHNIRWRQWLEEQLAGLGLSPVPSEANFVLTRFPDGAAAANAANAYLIADGIILRDMKAYGLDDCLRITVGDEAGLQAVVQSLATFLGLTA